MERFWLKFYLVIQYILSLVWFVLGTFLYIFLLMFTANENCNLICTIQTDGLLPIIGNLILTLIYVFVSYCLISSIKLTYRLLKGEALTTKNKIIVWLAVLFNIGIIALTLYMFFHK
nr:MAG TPA: hypothetical protein [Caudoviricetes sp.]